MGKYASKVIEQAKAWLGCNEYDGSHKQIIDIYNAHTPLARGYKVKYTDSWCATFVSAVSIKLGYTDIIPTECGCGDMVKLFQKLGTFVENDSLVPMPGSILFYDWQDDGKGDNTEWPDHVGIVEKVENGKITVIEGNYSNSVKRRTISVNAKNIRGYGVPKYDKEKNIVKEWQEAAIADGFEFPSYGADGLWGAECESVARKAIVKKRLTYKYKNLTKIVQKAVGVSVDGKCGKNTKKAIKEYQKKHGLKDDGEVGINTWKVILNIK